MAYEGVSKERQGLVPVSSFIQLQDFREKIWKQIRNLRHQVFMPLQKRFVLLY